MSVVAISISVELLVVVFATVVVVFVGSVVANFVVCAFLLRLVLAALVVHASGVFS
jgi:hypothetical protein